MIVTGGIVFYLLVVVAAWRFLRSSPELAGANSTQGISVLKPLAGPEPELESNLRSFFQLNYPSFELLFAAREESDPAIAVVRKLQREYPAVASKVVITGEPPFPNAKVYSLLLMAQHATHDLFVISDSDIRADERYLDGIASDFRDPRTGVSTCPYRAVPGASFWSLLEALGMNTEFWSGVLVARMLEGMAFAVGPTMAIRRECLEKIGGFESVGHYLAEDFVLGQRAHEQGFRVVLSRHVVEHRIGAQSFGDNFRHRLRWYRSTRRSRPAGYVGQVFTNPLPVALLAAAFSPAVQWTWWLLAVCLVSRIAALVAVGPAVLKDGLTVRYAWLVPVQDVASFVVWVLAFWGKTITWRGRTYELQKDGTLRGL